MMSELSFERSSGDSWDLQAIVKGQPTGNITTSNNIMEIPSSSFAWLEDYYYYQNLEISKNELHQLCMPNQHIISTISSPETFDSTIIATTMDDNSAAPESVPSIDDVSYIIDNPAMVPKRRKNKHKKTLVQQATGDRVSSDKWNWRKYGEKVIKGSPYPRSYYRCSNTGGCLARKQVEQSCTEPGIFLITYIDEHSHPYPTRRPSQAGRTSRRFRVAADVRTTSSESSSVGMSTMPTAPTTPPIANEGVYVPNYVVEDDFFAGLEYLESVKMDLKCDQFPFP